MSKKDIKDLEKKITDLDKEIIQLKDKKEKKAREKEKKVYNLVHGTDDAPALSADVIGKAIIEKILQINREGAERYNVDLLETDVDFSSGKYIGGYGQHILQTFSEAIKNLDRDSLFATIALINNISEKEKEEAKNCYNDIVRYYEEVTYKGETEFLSGTNYNYRSSSYDLIRKLKESNGNQPTNMNSTQQNVWEKFTNDREK